MACLSRFAFRAAPGKSGELEKELKKLGDLVAGVGGFRPRILHTHFASLGAPDIIFEQEAQDLASLEAQINKLTDNPEFKAWKTKISGLLIQSPKREVYLIVE
ncbi:MAG TPA: hypothetical protein VGA73_16805 [Candidatus Binatia bacterium]